MEVITLVPKPANKSLVRTNRGHSVSIQSSPSPHNFIVRPPTINRFPEISTLNGQKWHCGEVAEVTIDQSECSMALTC
jgi:hypothetical protein